MARWIVWVVVAASVVTSSLTESCTNPNGEVGEARLLDDCDPLLALAHKRSKTRAEWDFLRKSTCGFFKDGQPKVCCPLRNDKCVTPDGVSGKCVHQTDCSSLLSKLENPEHPSIKDRVFLKKYKCGKTRHNVCCPPAQEMVEVAPENKVCTPTAKPPSPTSGCCGDPGISDKIYGGVQTEIDDYPWLALIEQRKRDSSYVIICGGSLISGLYVLTAAHCVNMSNRPKLNVILGEYNTSSPGNDCVGDYDCTKGIQRIRVSRIIPYPTRHTGARDDIALLLLEQMLTTFSDFIKPICLPSSDITVNPPSDLQLVVAGWGLVDNKFFSDVKMHVKVPYVKLSTCMSEYHRYSYRQKLWYKQMCAGEPGRDSCEGDSGGPLMYFTGKRYEVVGIVSYGSKPCGGPLPTIHTNVHAYIEWIEKETSGLNYYYYKLDRNGNF